MRRLLILLAALLLALCTAPAFAQDEEDDPAVDDPTEQVDPEDEEDPVDEGEEEEIPADDAQDYTDYCDYGDYGDYEDYGYPLCSPVPSNPEAQEDGMPAGGNKRKDEDDDLQPVVQTLPASSLPLTGSEPLVIALIGLSFLLIGLGIREAAPPRSR